MKRLSIIGRGTAGCFAVTHFLKHTDWEIDWYYDPQIVPQAVGEASIMNFPVALADNIQFNYDDLISIGGFLKSGIYKDNWGDGHQFNHNFPMGAVAMHFNAVKLQDFIIEFAKKSSRIKIHEYNIDHNMIDSTYIMDCSGKPKDYTEFIKSEYIPVNSVYVTQCYWDRPKFTHSLTIARPYGWVFGIPLQNRCSIGYLFNNNFNTIEEVKEDVINIFDEFDLTPSQDTNTFSFNNYYRKLNFTDRVVYNGNSSFFLEPLEATSISFMDSIQRYAHDMWNNKASIQDVNYSYRQRITEIETIIMLHYCSGSKFNTPFWEYAKNNGHKKIDSVCRDENFQFIIESTNNPYKNENINYGTWPPLSMYVNLKNLGLLDFLREKIKLYK
jgi:tryptophan 7-halogenase